MSSTGLRPGPWRAARRVAALPATLVLGLAMLLGLAPVEAGVAQESTPVTTPAGAALAWAACADGAPGWECATLAVPLDDADPTGRTIGVAVTRLPAGDPARRIGALVLNCGGPGCPAVRFLHEVGPLLFPDEFRARFDLVGFDPRGTGQSSPLDCRIDWDAYLAIDPSPDDDAEREAWLAGGRAYATACAANGGDVLPFMDTEHVTSDLERLRRALGEETISFLGLSYGTSLGARYADRHPDRVRAFALDSALPAVVDPVTFVPQWVDAIERSFDGFLADCAAARTCAFHAGGDPAGAFDALMVDLDAAPLAVGAGGAGATRLVGQRAVLDAVDVTLSRPTRWSELATALAAAARGDGAAVLALADQRNERQPDGSYAPGAEVFLAVSCLDFPIARDEDAFAVMATKAATIAPRLGAFYTTWVLPCASWPAPATLAPHAPRAAGAPPILVVGATLDTQDAYSWSVDMAGQLESGVLLRREGTGHPSYLNSACVEAAVNAYLLDLTLPDPNLICSSTGGLFEQFR
jgi:pimeloyl-ACP methyl ester carboxylesterase